MDLSSFKTLFGDNINSPQEFFIDLNERVQNILNTYPSIPELKIRTAYLTRAHYYINKKPFNSYIKKLIEHLKPFFSPPSMNIDPSILPSLIKGISSFSELLNEFLSS
ncbi:MAG: hypothetical protein ACTSPH_10765 [Promethearchaeota archaeon]